MPRDAGHGFCRFAMTFNAPMSLFYIFRRKINDSHYYYMFVWLTSRRRCQYRHWSWRHRVIQKSCNEAQHKTNVVQRRPIRAAPQWTAVVQTTAARTRVSIYTHFITVVIICICIEVVQVVLMKAHLGMITKFANVSLLCFIEHI